MTQTGQHGCRMTAYVTRPTCQKNVHIQGLFLILPNQVLSAFDCLNQSLKMKG